MMHNVKSLSFGLVSVLVLFLTATPYPSTTAVADSPPEEGSVRARAEITQESGKVVYWVLPGKRRLSKDVFGTPDNPKFTLKQALSDVDDPRVRRLLQQLPFLVSAPLKHRATGEDGKRFTELTTPSPFSDRAVPLSDGGGQSGSFRATYVDRVNEDREGPPGKTPDEAQLRAEFHDPQGNRYVLELDHVIQPPFPSYRTRGGVMIDDVHHGSTGTGSPLMPRVYTRAALWGVARVTVNGTPLDGLRVVHVMTTEIVRDREYRLAIDEELPLEPSERHIPDQPHHTHLMVLPIEPVTNKGPTFNPRVTAFVGEEGDTQPFIHLMFEQDRVEEWDLAYLDSSPSKDSDGPVSEAAGSGGEASGESSDASSGSDPVQVEIVARKLKFHPDHFTVKEGQKVTVTLVNDGFVSHGFSIGEYDLHSKTIQPGQKTRVTFVAKQSGTLKFTCNVAEHKLAGMTGQITVE